ncbi:MAG: choice-of-anchor Q domain-containing protein [Chloroflexota bacterium]|nr:choice-of-anchor Q domain-containing protein [Chloroflexota bacterium]
MQPIIRWMLCIFAAILLLAIAPLAQPAQAQTGRTFYVAPDGNDSNPGTEAQPFRTIQRGTDSAVAGDTVLVKNGTYDTIIAQGVAIHMRVSGTANAWITLRAYPGHRPRIVSRADTAILIDGSYIEVSGFEIAGNSQGSAQFAGNGITTRLRAHHIRIISNTIYGFGGSGVNTTESDYLHIEGNTVFNNAWGSDLAQSAISLWRLTSADQSTGYRNIIRRNTVFNNYNTRPFRFTGTVTDGNCIIIDSARDTGYAGRTLVENNLCFDNGGRGVHIFRSDNVDVFNNTLFFNLRTQELEGGGSELSAIDAGNVRFFNNIVYARLNEKANEAYNSSNIVFDNNLYYGTTVIPNRVATDIVGLDPLFVNATTVATSANFTLLPGSPAINAVQNGIFPPIDLYGTIRPQGVRADIGAVEVATLATSGTLNGTVALQGRTSGSPTMSVVLSVELIQNSTVISTHTPTSTTGGAFTISSIPFGNYVVRVKHSQYLAVTSPAAFSAAGAFATVNFGTLRAGDVNNNNTVALDDFSLLSGSMNRSSGQSGFSALADLNGDGAVSLVDFSLLAGNFNQTGQ